MWTHILKRIHPEIVFSVVEPSEVGPIESAFELLVAVTELGSDVRAMAPAYLSSARTFLAQANSVTGARQKLEAGARLTAAEWLYLSYLADILNRLRVEWEEFYESSLVAEEIRELARAVRTLLGDIPFDRGLVMLAAQWDESARDAGFRAAALLYVRACSCSGLHALPTLHKKLVEQLSFDNHFLVVYLAASCLKLDAVAVRVDIPSWKNVQYACLMLMDTFHFLPGGAWG
jgi:hypothetical protein